ncbi:sensor histidine kinase [Taibaiella lutea]|nr:histidine kinase [Taibaiella lutea]
MCFFTKANAQLLTYKTLSAEDGLLSIEVHTIIQDSKGYVWIGTKNGLCRWDSKNFEYFTIADGLPNNEVLYVYEDSKGRIWISCFSEELCYYFNGRIYNSKNAPFLNKIKSQQGLMFIEQNNEFYYKSTDASLIKFNLLTQKSTVIHDSLKAAAFFFIINKGKVWGFQDERNRNRLIAKDARNLILNEDTSYYTPYYFCPNLPSNNILTCIDFRHKRYSFQKGLDTPFYHANYTNKEFRFAIYNEGRIMEIYNNYILQKKDNYKIKVDYPDRQQTIDIKKNLFMVTTDGLLFCRQMPVLEYEQNSRINNNAKFLFRYGGEVYIVNNRYELINVNKQQKINQLKSNAINLYNLLSFEGKFYLSTSFDLYRFADPNKKIEDLNYLRYSNFKYISPSKKANHLFTANGLGPGIFLISPQTHTYDTLLLDIQKNVYSIFEDSHSRLWYSTTDKVYYTDEYYNGIKRSREFVLDPSSPVFCKSIGEDNKGNLFFTTNGGVFVYDGKHKYRIDQASLLSDNECSKVVIDTLRSSFWVATKDGLNRIGYYRENGILKFKVLSKFFASDGLRSDNISDILLDSNKLYIATDKGVNILDDVNYRPDTMPIPVYVKLTAINAAANKGYDTIKTIELEHDRNNLTIGFSALYFLRRDRLKIKAYLYRDNSLVSQNDVTGDKIDYYSLNDGDYKLVLYAFDQDYHYNNGQSTPFEFTIKPPYYKTWWFIIGSSLLVIIISTSLMLWNLTRRKKRAIQQAELQARLNESTLKSLQSQMNPHFVFNSLNTIQSFITEKDEAGAIDYLSDFSVLMREILEQSVHTFISLENEIQFLKQYMQLEITRYKHSFDIAWDIKLDEEDLTDIYIPTMLIQPILENAVKHGVSALNDVKGHIEVTFGLVNKHLLGVTIKDNGQPSGGKSFKGNSIAVQTIKDRLNIYTKNKVKGEYHLLVAETGATATITIPI